MALSSSSGVPLSSPTLGLIDINTSLLWSRRQELKLIAVQSAHISSHLSHIGTTLQLMADKWSQSTSEFNTKCSDFDRMLQGRSFLVAMAILTPTESKLFLSCPHQRTTALQL